MSWAYPVNPATVASPPAAADVPRHIDGSTATFTKAQLTDRFAVPDWQPADHPPMPQVVAHGRKPAVAACGFCHLPTGNGRPENAALAGEPREYIAAQIRAFKDGSRSSSVTGRAPNEMMASLAAAATEAEIEAAASYFSALPRSSFIRVVESTTAPKVRIANWIYARDPAGGVEPIGARIVEVPDSFDTFERRDPHTRYVAYVPPGSIARGRRLAQHWGDDQFACSACHGADLKGSGSIPAITGRSPSYVVRQLNDFRTGARRGSDAAAMVPVVSAMRDDDMVALAAFLATRAP